MSLVERIFNHGAYAAATPEDFGFERLPVEQLTEEDVIKVYLDYRATGGEPIAVWERQLGALESDVLERLKQEYERERSSGQLGQSSGSDD